VIKAKKDEEERSKPKESKEEASAHLENEWGITIDSSSEVLEAEDRSLPAGTERAWEESKKGMPSQRVAISLRKPY
tara:strand:+ start:2029 stop:2256 length:228 start_codon:yes stop_codon:yes gene_type:complete